MKSEGHGQVKYIKEFDSPTSFIAIIVILERGSHAYIWYNLLTFSIHVLAQICNCNLIFIVVHMVLNQSIWIKVLLNFHKAINLNLGMVG